MSRASWLPDVLKDAGLKVGLVAGWDTRGSADFDGTTPEGIMYHHTASLPSWGTHPALGICTNGRSDLPGPLCNILTPRTGDAFDVYVVASGRANHAGYGGPLGTVPVNSGNKYYLGDEVENAGTGAEAWSAELKDRLVVIHGAILRHLGWPVTKGTLPGHKEWAPSRKIDPHPITMTDHRGAVTQWINEGGNEVDKVQFNISVGEASAYRVNGKLAAAGYADTKPIPQTVAEYEDNPDRFKGLWAAVGKARAS